MLSREVQATLLLIGTIVGVGMFAIPFVFIQAGFWLGVLELAALAGAATIIHLAYSEVVLSTAKLHRLPGYARIYLGKLAGRIGQVSHLFGLSGALLAYLVLGGFFLNSLLKLAWPGAPGSAGVVLFYLLGVGITSKKIRFESIANAVLTIVLIAALVSLALILLPEASFESYRALNIRKAFLPYGVLLFAMAGAAVVPELRRVLARGGLKSFSRIVIGATLGAAAIYFVFAAAIVGATAGATTPDAISGLAALFGQQYFIAGALIGFLACITSFVPLSIVTQGVLVSDMGAKAKEAWAIVSVIPAALYLFGFNDFLMIISAVGALAIGIDSLLIIMMHGKLVALRQRQPETKIVIPQPLRYLLISVFVLGVFYELAKLL